MRWSKAVAAEFVLVAREGGMNMQMAVLCQVRSIVGNLQCLAPKQSGRTGRRSANPRRLAPRGMWSWGALHEYGYHPATISNSIFESMS